MFYYPFDPRIHNMGNIGTRGAIHAELAPIFTKLIDIKAYSGRNIRQEITNNLLKNENNPRVPRVPRVLDLCCGIGLSTAEGGYGIDTSQQMIYKANRHHKFSKSSKKFMVNNAEIVKIEDFEKKYSINFDKFDYVTCMFAFHEMPEYAHRKIIENSLELAKKEILIVDISPEYKSSELMRNGEPYLIDYQKSIEKTMNKYNAERTDYVKGHVSIWKI
jgi:SAM-dependent methyltransferase